MTILWQIGFTIIIGRKKEIRKMRLMHPSPGEIMDRWTILELKIKAADKQGKDPSRFLAEKAVLDEALKNWKGILEENFIDIDGYEQRLYEIGQQVNALTAVNSLLWDAEDRVRALPEIDDIESEDQVEALAILCKDIARLNDDRADLVKKISELYGEKEEVHEKIYGVKLSK
jgi:hypothetical protein